MDSILYIFLILQLPMPGENILLFGFPLLYRVAGYAPFIILFLCAFICVWYLSLLILDPPLTAPCCENLLLFNLYIVCLLFWFLSLHVLNKSLSISSFLYIIQDESLIKKRLGSDVFTKLNAFFS